MSTLSPHDNANAHAIAAMRAGRAAEARSILQAAVVDKPDDVSMWLNLAGACRAMNDVPAAFGAIEGALAAHPRSFPALLMKASLLEREGEITQAGIGYGLALSQAPDPSLLDPATRKAFDHAREVRAAYETGLRDRLLAASSEPAAPEGARKGGASRASSIT